MVPAYKLTYCPVKALAEPIRLLMSYGNIEFEDFRFDMDDWPQIKATTPFGQVPVLEFKGTTAYQSIAICRYLAKQVKLTGANDIEDLEIDAVVDTVMDLRTKIVEYFYEEDAAVKERRRKPLFEETLPFYMKRMEAAAKKNKSHLAAGKLTWADVHFVGIVDYLSFMIGRDLLADCPSLQVMQKTVLKLPGIKEWVVKRPVTDY
ncbi:glutathione S-transferase-like [Photinus pyralis]|nr:glutathione S-transferase-like [Photinus pyralis]